MSYPYPYNDRELQNSEFVESKPYPQARYIAEKPANGPFKASYPQKLIRYGVNTIGELFAPAAPVGGDRYNQDAQVQSGEVYAGAAPTAGIYTGIEAYDE